MELTRADLYFAGLIPAALAITIWLLRHDKVTLAGLATAWLLTFLWPITALCVIGACIGRGIRALIWREP